MAEYLSHSLHFFIIERFGTYLAGMKGFSQTKERNNLWLDLRFFLTVVVTGCLDVWVLGWDSVNKTDNSRTVGRPNLFVHKVHQQADRDPDKTEGGDTTGMVIISLI